MYKSNDSIADKSKIYPQEPYDVMKTWAAHVLSSVLFPCRMYMFLVHCLIS